MEPSENLAVDWHSPGREQPNLCFRTKFKLWVHCSRAMSDTQESEPAFSGGGGLYGFFTQKPVAILDLNRGPYYAFSNKPFLKPPVNQNLWHQGKSKPQAERA